jgi:hypothetical protein
MQSSEPFENAAPSPVGSEYLANHYLSDSDYMAPDVSVIGAFTPDIDTI